MCQLTFPYSCAQTEQMSRIVNELDSIHFSIKKATQLVKEIGRQVNIFDLSHMSNYCHYTKFLTLCFIQVATDRCIMALLFLIVIGVISIIIVKVRYLFSLHFFIVFLIKLLSDFFSLQANIGLAIFYVCGFFVLLIIIFID